MSRTWLIRPRRPRAVRDRPATGTRLLPNPHSPNTHYKRCPRAERLRPRSDQPLSRPVPVTGYGRFPDKNRLALGKGPCQVRAPLTRRKGIASSGDAHEHGVIVLPRAIAPPWASAPFSDSPGADPAGQSEQSDNLRLKINAPFKDSTVVTTGEHPTTNGGHGSPLPSLRMVEHFWWTGLPHTENFSALLHILSEVRGKDSTVVTTGKHPTTNGGHGSPLPSLRVVEHFWWTGLPHTENFSGLLHILSEVRGRRRVVADVKRPQRRTPRIGTGVADLMRKRPGPSITSTPFFSVIPSLLPSNELEAEAGAFAPASASVLLSPSPLKALRERGIKGVRVPLWGRGVPPAEALESLSQSGRGTGIIHPRKGRGPASRGIPSPPRKKPIFPKTIKHHA